ncbi:MAG: hypothetical protein FWF51_11265 [Chitinivibrionia bacterium]|jgi:hypothetical protein|nr:hypothetical protein [Chitinivibrionia bacterium]
MNSLKYFVFFGALAFLLVLESKVSDYLARDILNKKSEISSIEKEIAFLKQSINSTVAITDIRSFADEKKLTLTNPMDIITLETRKNNYAVKGENYNIVEQIMTLWE